MYNWLYNEYKHCGVDYADEAQVAVYDAQHQQFRDFDREARDFVEKLQLTKEQTLVDLGSGTGALAISLAAHVKHIYSVDVSEAMLTYQQSKARAKHINNISFGRAGFLTYTHQAEPVDVVHSKAALHHLPDFWKQVALNKIYRLLKPGGVFYLFDIVFHFNPDCYAEKIAGWVEKMAINDAFRQEIESHIRDEHSTFHWVMSGMLEEAGFTIEKAVSPDEFQTEYICRK